MARIQLQLRYLDCTPSVSLTPEVRLKWQEISSRFPEESAEVLEELDGQLLLGLLCDPADGLEEDVTGNRFFSFCNGFEGWKLGNEYPKEFYCALAGIFGVMQWRCYAWESVAGTEVQFSVTVTPTACSVEDAS